MSFVIPPISREGDAGGRITRAIEFRGSSPRRLPPKGVVHPARANANPDGFDLRKENLETTCKRGQPAGCGSHADRVAPGRGYYISDLGSLPFPTLCPLSRPSPRGEPEFSHASRRGDGENWPSIRFIISQRDTTVATFARRYCREVTTLAACKKLSRIYPASTSSSLRRFQRRGGVFVEARMS